MNIRGLIKVNSLSADYFCAALGRSVKAQEYVRARLPQNIIDSYKIGYAPPFGLIGHLNAHNIEEHNALEVGVIGKDTKDSTYYETFRKRIMVPIVHAGAIVGFGGRDITGRSGSKYLNSKKSVLYDKSAVLYGLWRAIEHIDALGYVILVEGYFDVLSLKAVGISNAVASCGTALTEKHVNAIKLFTDTVYILMDGDSPGQNAAGKARKLLQKKGLHTNVAILPDEKDPDDFVKEFGKDELLNLIGA